VLRNTRCHPDHLNMSLRKHLRNTTFGVQTGPNWARTGPFCPYLPNRASIGAHRAVLGRFWPILDRIGVRTTCATPQTPPETPDSVPKPAKTGPNRLRRAQMASGKPHQNGPLAVQGLKRGVSELKTVFWRCFGVRTTCATPESPQNTPFWPVLAPFGPIWAQIGPK